MRGLQGSSRSKPLQWNDDSLDENSLNPMWGSSSIEASLSVEEEKEPAVVPKESAAVDIATLATVRENVDMNMAMDFQGMERLGAGATAVVYRAVRQDVGQVALKVLRPDHTDTDLRDVMEEAAILSRIKHDNIIGFFGMGKSPRPFMVLEYLGAGVLPGALSRAHPYEAALPTLARRRFPFIKALHVAHSLCSALVYLHEEAFEDSMIIHRDIKPENVGFSYEGRALLLDFGLATVLRKRSTSTEAYALTGCTGSTRYMAPEVFLNEPYGESVDVYSLGMVLWEMCTLVKPFQDMDEHSFSTRVVGTGERPPMGPDWPLRLRQAFSEAWDGNWRQRPRARRLLGWLDELLAEEQRRLEKIAEDAGCGSLGGCLVL